MRAIIDGKRYDTDRADLVAEFASQHATSDFKWYEEALYLTPRGNWFVAGSGHAASPYGERYADGMGPGSAIRPLSAAKAQAWLEEHGEVEALEEHFGESIIDA